MVVTSQSLLRTGPRMMAGNGAKNSPTRAKKDGPRRRDREEAKNGMKIGIKNVKHFKKRKTRKEMNSMNMSPTEKISKNKTARNGVRTLTLTKNGTKNGAKFIEMTNVKSGATNGK